jgi:hypothetical protein
VSDFPRIMAWRQRFSRSIGDRCTMQAKDVVGFSVSITALVLSVVSFVANFNLTHQSAVLARKPVLVFQYNGEMGWTLRNVGSGPALDVMVAKRESSGPWHEPVRAPAISKDGEIKLYWLGQTNARSLGASYADFEGVRYTTISEADVSQVKKGDLLGQWTEKDIKPFWIVDHTQ